MPRSKANNKPKRRGGGRKRKPRRRKRQGARRPRISPQEAMLANPCRAPLVPGFFGTNEGYLTRTKSVWNPTFGAPSCGYCIWVPEFSTGLVGPSPHFKGNLFYYQSENTQTRPLNTNVGAQTYKPYGTQAHTMSQYDTAERLQDPAVSLNIGPARDVRCISACMRMSYFGRLDASAGQVAYIQGLPLSDILGGDDNDNQTPTLPMSVDELFKVATSVQRFGVDTIEIIHKPKSDTSGIFHTEHDGAMDIGNLVLAQTTIIDEVVRHRGMTCFGIAWRGTAELAAADSYGFEFFKNVEWRPKPVLGLTHVPPTATRSPTSVDKMVAHLESISPNYAERVVSTAKSGVSHLLEGVYAGVERQAHNAARDFGFAAVGGLLAF